MIQSQKREEYINKILTLMSKINIYEICHEKNNILHKRKQAQISFAVIGKLISTFVLATRIVQLLYFLNPKFPASYHLTCLYSSVCVGPVQKPHCWFSHDVAQLNMKMAMRHMIKVMQ